MIVQICRPITTAVSVTVIGVGVANPWLSADMAIASLNVRLNNELEMFTEPTFR